MEKNLKLLDISGKSKEEQAEIAERRKAFGAATHRRYVQEIENRLREEEAQREAKYYQDLLEQYGKEYADKAIEKRRLRDERKGKK